ncbi:MAG: cyclic nucleotide-binding domain-containing protein [Lachnospiraceae bacterium]|nr:cyclic nucleotide-binding domain-containing protein [Lachnospiraceae bacterium]
MNIEVAKNCGKIKSYERGSFLCKEGEEGYSLFIILKGLVAVVIKSYSPHPEVIVSLGAGSFVGEMSLFIGKPRTASIMALEDDTMVLEIQNSNFRDFLKYDPDTCYKLVKSIVERIDNMLVKLNKYEPRVCFQFRKNSIYQIANGVNPASFIALANAQPNVVVKLLTGLCSSLDDFNKRYAKATDPNAQG